MSSQIKVPFDPSIYKIIDNILSPDEIVSINAKVLNLNFFKSQLLTLSGTTANVNLLAKISSLELILEDAYELDMYQFQFKIFIETLSKEIKNIQEEISFGD